MRGVILAATIGGFLLSLPVQAHEMRRDSETFVTYGSTVDFVLANRYDQGAVYVFEMYSKDWTPTPIDSWYVDNGFNRISDITLEAGSEVTITAHVRDKGKYYFCSKLEEFEDEQDIKMRSRICNRISRQ